MASYTLSPHSSVNSLLPEYPFMCALFLSPFHTNTEIKCVCVTCPFSVYCAAPNLRHTQSLHSIDSGLDAIPVWIDPVRSDWRDDLHRGSVVVFSKQRQHVYQVHMAMHLHWDNTHTHASNSGKTGDEKWEETKWNKRKERCVEKTKQSGGGLWENNHEQRKELRLGIN